jgi:hypothetical protein
VLDQGLTKAAEDVKVLAVWVTFYLGASQMAEARTLDAEIFGPKG